MNNTRSQRRRGQTQNESANWSPLHCVDSGDRGRHHQQVQNWSRRANSLRKIEREGLQKVVFHEFGSAILHRIPEKPQGGLMLERWVEGVAWEKLAQDRFPKIEHRTPAEEEYVYMPRSHMITKADLSKAEGWTQGCRKCRVMKEGDHSRTTLAHGAECRARVAVILADDVGVFPWSRFPKCK